MKIELIFLIIVFILIFLFNNTNDHIEEDYTIIDKDNIITDSIDNDSNIENNSESNSESNDNCNNTNIINNIPIIYKGKLTRDSINSEIGGYTSFNLNVDNSIYNNIIDNNIVDYKINDTYTKTPLDINYFLSSSV